MGGLTDGGGGGHGDESGDDGELDSKGGVEVMASGETTGMTWEWWKWQQQEEPQVEGFLFFPLTLVGPLSSLEHTRLSLTSLGALPLTLSGR